MRQINDVVNTLPEQEEPTAVFLTAPGRAYTDEELAALADNRDCGGAVVLLGSAAADPGHRSNLNAVAAGLGSDLRLNGDRVVNPESNVADDPALPVTSRFDDRFPLFSPVGSVEELVVRYGSRDSIEVGLVLGDVHITGSATIDGTVEIDGSIGGDVALDGAADVGGITVAGDVVDGADVSGASALEGTLVVNGTVGSDVVLQGSPTVGSIEIAEHEGEVVERGKPRVGAAAPPGRRA